MTKNILAY